MCFIPYLDVNQHQHPQKVLFTTSSLSLSSILNSKREPSERKGWFTIHSFIPSKEHFSKKIASQNEISKGLIDVDSKERHRESERKRVRKIERKRDLRKMIMDLFLTRIIRVV